MYTLEKVTSESVGKAKRNIDRALKGEIPPRKPLDVLHRGDGTYVIIDGNNTYTAVKEMGAKNVPVTVHTIAWQKDVNTIEELYAKNRAVESEFHALMASLRDEFGAELLERKGLKSEARVIEKVKTNIYFDGDLRRITDILAATLVFDTEEKLLTAVEVLKSRNYVVCVFDRWRGRRDDGYRDFLLNIALSNGAIAELQLHHGKIAGVKGYLGHSLYEFVRSNEGKAGTSAWIGQALAIERAFYDAALTGDYDEMSEDSRIKARAIARRLAAHSKDRPEEVQPLLNMLSRIVKDELRRLTDGIFAKLEINRMIDKNYAQVQKEGYSELRIPMSLHGITCDVFSPNALDTADRLMKAGFKVYLVGGTIRDLAAGREGNDFDFSTDASIEEQSRIFADSLIIHEEQNGTFTRVHYPDEDIDLAQFLNIPPLLRGLKGMPETDSDGLFTKSILIDSCQRDLTINALYYDMANGDLIDFHGSLHDLREGIIDTVIEPELEFMPAVRPTAALRAFRFKARFNFKFSDRLEKAFRKDAIKYVKYIMPATNSYYIRRMFKDGCLRRNFDTLTEYGVFGYFFPAVKDLCSTTAYRNYASGAMDFLDRQTEAGMKVSPSLVLALLLRPALENSTIDDILDSQAEVWEYEPGEREAIEKILRSITDIDEAA